MNDLLQTAEIDGAVNLFTLKLTPQKINVSFFVFILAGARAIGGSFFGLLFAVLFLICYFDS